MSMGKSYIHLGTFAAFFTDSMLVNSFMLESTFQESD